MSNEFLLWAAMAAGVVVVFLMGSSEWERRGNDGMLTLLTLVVVAIGLMWIISALGR